MAVIFKDGNLYEEYRLLNKYEGDIILVPFQEPEEMIIYVDCETDFAVNTPNGNSNYVLIKNKYQGIGIRTMKHLYGICGDGKTVGEYWQADLSQHSLN